MAGGAEPHTHDFEDEITMTFEPPEAKPNAAPKPPELKQTEYDEFGLPIKRPQQYYYEDTEGSEDGDGPPKVPPKLPPKPDAGPVSGGLGHAATKRSTEELAGQSSIPAATVSCPGLAENNPPKPASARSSEELAKNNQVSTASVSEEEKWKSAFKSLPDYPSEPQAGATKVSEFSHQQIADDADSKKDSKNGDASLDSEWQEMPSYASHDMWDDEGRLIARAHEESDSDDGDGAVKGYTRVFDDEDADSVTSMDENTRYLFNENEDDEASRNPLSQMQATKEILTEGQRIAYVGVCRLALAEMLKDLDQIAVKGRTAKKVLTLIKENMKMWSQKIMMRLYTHMDISPPEQVMIEQLESHGVLPADLTPALMTNSKVVNPMAPSPSPSSSRNSVYRSAPNTPNGSRSRVSLSPGIGSPPPPYEEPDSIKNPMDIAETKTLDIDLRWTVLCDLFLVLIADSVYDARGRTLLERVGKMIDVSWIDICKFEKRVTDALEMQEEAQQNWSEAEHIANRDKQARNRRYLMLGLATVGGGLVIGLSGGLLAPMIGAGLAAGFTTIGVAGTSGFLAGTGGTALIASGAVVSGSVIGGKAGFNRMKSVKTFEFKPLHNAKRVNLIITVAGWMNGKVDDVRLPFSTVDPIMGDLYSIWWEPEMLQSMGQTINILATEVLTQSLQQVLGSTILVALMASLQLPVVLTKLSYLLDNPWSVSLDRATAAGLILADTLVHRNLGNRPVTLVGYSLGARVIHSCLKELARVGAVGLVQNAYMFGSPVVVKRDEYSQAVSVVSGRVVNGYATNDWILGYLFRATSGGIGRVAGLAPVADVPKVENVDVTELVKGHMAYRQAMPKVLSYVGWEVTSDEFSEIEDPDPENHNQRQRELINELDEARKELEKQPEKKRFFGLFSKKEAVKKKDWETYDLPTEEEKKKAAEPNTEKSDNEGILFDIDAIRAELANQETEEKEDGKEADDVLQVKELPSTLGQLKISTADASSKGLYDNLRQTKSFNDVATTDTKNSAPSFEYEYEGRGYDSFELSHGEGEIQLSFEPPPRPAAASTFDDERPPLKPSYTAPPNVWADDDYDEFAPREDGEVQITFA